MSSGIRAYQNSDLGELEIFDAMAHSWWDPAGAFKTLHDINPLRLQWVGRHMPGESFTGQRVADVGCGGGLLSEAMAAVGADVTGIDMSCRALSVAKLHLLESGLKVEYLQQAAESLAAERGNVYDAITCMELLEHVPEPQSVVNAAARLAKPGGMVFFSTINRNPKAYVYAILGAEYLLRWLPIGTHNYASFIRPSELIAWAERSGLQIVDIKGISYNPFFASYRISDDVSINYMLATRRPL